MGDGEAGKVAPLFHGIYGRDGKNLARALPWERRGADQADAPERTFPIRADGAMRPRPARSAPLSRRRLCEATVSTEQPEAGEEAWLSAPHVHPRRPGGPPGPSPQGPPQAVRLSRNLPACGDSPGHGRGGSTTRRPSRPCAAVECGVTPARCRSRGLRGKATGQVQRQRRPLLPTPSRPGWATPWSATGSVVAFAPCSNTSDRRRAPISLLSDRTPPTSPPPS